MIPNLRQYDVILINTSGGKDSQAMLDYVAKLAEQDGVTDRLVAVHSDLGRVEWDGTAELAAEQVAHYGIRFEMTHRLTAAGERQDLLQQIEARGRFPDASNRYCTSDHKRGPILRVITKLVNEQRARHLGRPVMVLNCMGLRAQESAQRALAKPFGRNLRATNSRRDVFDWLPIHHWTEDQVWERIKASGVRHHWAYDAGLPRLSCSFCVLAGKSALIRAAQLRPQLAADYAAVEARIDHRFKNDLSMAQVIELARTTQVDTVDSWAA